MAGPSAVVTRRRRGLLWPGVFAAVGVAVLLALGTWQLQRLAWKESLLSAIDARIHQAPAPIRPPSDWPSLKPEDYEYRRVSVAGMFEHAKEALVFRPQGTGAAQTEGPGYLVLTPLRLSDGTYVIVDRGFVPAARGDPSTRPGGQIAGEVTITGLMRSPEQRNLFTPADDPDKGQWYTRDPALIAAHFKLDRTAPFSIDADDTPVPGGWPKGGQTVLAIPNDHLQYALTWYGLAATLVGVFAAYAWSRRGGPVG
ncbi:MAG: SURF1 family protein [Methylobacteriaceae bacterium]|nr:SURF1 family protein [Methylobacteriaceae bacterium]